MAHRRMPFSALCAVPLAVACALSFSCSQPASPSPTPEPFDPNAPRVGAHTGSVAIEYLGTNIAPGLTITGCGPTLAGCAGRLRLTFRLRSSGAGSVLRTAGSLHGANKVPCLSAVGGAFSLAANTTLLLDLVFDDVNPACALPFESTDLGINVEGSADASGRQEFGIRYRFAQ